MFRPPTPCNGILTGEYNIFITVATYFQLGQSFHRKGIIFLFNTFGTVSHTKNHFGFIIESYASILQVETKKIKHWQSQQVSAMQELLALPICFSNVVHQSGCCSAWLQVSGAKESCVERRGVKWSIMEYHTVLWREQSVVEWKVIEMSGIQQQS